MNWSSVKSASGTPWSSVVSAKVVQGSTVGSPIGLLLAMTYATALGGTWTKVTQATGTMWSSVLTAA